MTLPIEQMEVCSDLISCASCTLISLNLNFSFGLANLKQALAAKAPS
jgi:hypothetical protein